MRIFISAAVAMSGLEAIRFKSSIPKWGLGLNGDPNDVLICIERCLHNQII